MGRLVLFNVWAPGFPWHQSTLAYPHGGDWRRSYVRLLQAHVDLLLRPAA